MNARNGTLTATLTAVLVLSALVVAPLTGAAGSTNTTLPEPGGGEVSSAEDDEEPVFDVQFDVRMKENAPDTVDTQHTILAQGLTENITVHFIGIRSEAFDYSNCSPDKTTALGIDRGNDDDGTVTDRSVLSSYQKFTYDEDAIVLSFYAEQTLAGEPVDAYVTDELVAQQGNCIDLPSDPGWYQFDGFINGSSNGNTNTDYLIEARSNYVYVCDCENEQEARETLGPPPNEQGQSTPTPTPAPTATATSAPERTATATSAPERTATPTATPERTATATPTASATATPTPASESTATSTPTPEQPDEATGGGGTATPERTATATATIAGDDGQQAPPESAGNQQEGPRTPTVAAGSGFGVAAALLGVLSLVVLARRRR